MTSSATSDSAATAAARSSPRRRSDTSRSIASSARPAAISQGASARSGAAPIGAARAPGIGGAASGPAMRLDRLSARRPFSGPYSPGGWRGEAVCLGQMRRR